MYEYLQRFLLSAGCCLLAALTVTAQTPADRDTSAATGTLSTAPRETPPSPKDSGARAPRAPETAAPATESTAADACRAENSPEASTAPAPSNDEALRTQAAVKARLLRCREHPEICVQRNGSSDEAPFGSPKSATPEAREE